MDVGNFLQLQRAFQRDGVVNAASEEEEVVGAVVFLGQVLGLFVARQQRFQLAGMRVSSLSSFFDFLSVDRAAHLPR